jgi:hypothetical protein
MAKGLVAACVLALAASVRARAAAPPRAPAARWGVGFSRFAGRRAGAPRAAPRRRRARAPATGAPLARAWVAGAGVFAPRAARHAPAAKRDRGGLCTRPVC